MGRRRKRKDFLEGKSVPREGRIIEGKRREKRGKYKAWRGKRDKEG